MTATNMCSNFVGNGPVFPGKLKRQSVHLTQILDGMGMGTELFSHRPSLTVTCG